MPRLRFGRFSIPLPLFLLLALCAGVGMGFYSPTIRAQGKPPAQKEVPEGAIPYANLVADAAQKKPNDETRASADAVTNWAKSNENWALWKRFADRDRLLARARRAESEAGLRGFVDRGVK